jgi:hypothetical protein
MSPDAPLRLDPAAPPSRLLEVLARALRRLRDRTRAEHRSPRGLAERGDSASDATAGKGES